MADKRDRLEAIGRAVQAGQAHSITAQVVGRGVMDPAKELLLKQKTFVDEDFSGRRLDWFCSIASKFKRCSFRDIRIADMQFGAGMKESVYLDCVFDGAKFRATTPGRARFENCSFRNVTIYELFANRVDFVNCVFSGRLNKGVINGSRDLRYFRWWERRRNRITGNDFSGMKFGDLDFRGGVDLTDQVLPQSAGFTVLWEAEKSVLRARPRVANWTDSEAKRLAGIILDVIALNVAGGQKQVLFRVDPRGLFAEASARLAKELEIAA